MMKSAEPYILEQRLLTAITTVLSHYITETDPYILFNGLLGTLLEITDSEYGFIGEVFYSQDGEPYIKNYATTNIAWSDETKHLYEKNKQTGMLFMKLTSLYGTVLKTGQLVISNQPSTDPRSCGLPPGHPSLNAFMGIPLYGGGKLLGMVGIANRKTGYQVSLADSLHPFLITCGNLIQAYRENIKHKQVEAELSKFKERLLTINKTISLGFGYVFINSPPTLIRNDRPVLLTKKELALLEILVSHRNMPCQNFSIEKHVWDNILVGESSLRSLVRHLRRKLPELPIKSVSGIGYILTTPD